MSDKSAHHFWQRRRFLQIGLGGAIGLAGGAIALNYFKNYFNGQNKAQLKNQLSSNSIAIPAMNNMDTKLENVYNSGFNPMAIAREFDYGRVSQENGRTVREFFLTARTTPLQLDANTKFITWNVNGRVPAPTLRATEGDLIRVAFSNQGGHSHSLHFHGVHRAEMDGVKPIRNNSATIYEFDAESFGIYPYHCHVEPVTRHVSKGLYGMLIVDPPTPRPPADEIVLIMGGYDINNDRKNEFYAFNGIPHYYMHQPIQVYQDRLLRLYVLNMIEFDPVATFHIHANMFKVFPSGRTLEPTLETDVITMGTAERHILELSYRYPGKYMFHPHQDSIAEAGCMGNFVVLPNA
jgi:manganese oxidase